MLISRLCGGMQPDYIKIYTRVFDKPPVRRDAENPICIFRAQDVDKPPVRRDAGEKTWTYKNSALISRLCGGMRRPPRDREEVPLISRLCGGMP